MSPAIIFICGVSGSGKTTIGQQAAREIDLPFFDADDFHPAANKEKMAAGIPLTDEDRMPWLQALNQLAGECLEQAGAVIACSALKQSYRDKLAQGITAPLYWVWLYGEQGLIEKRMRQRSAHFMPASLLASQLSIAEPPFHAIHINISQPVQEITASVVRYVTGG
ncbi:MAG TPA: gluconokinase [Chitinophagaceae bacterium]|nr:gluconokinase [Chitinophagaceae bacterium]